MRFLEMQLPGMLTSRIFVGLSILTSKNDPENSDRYLQDWLFYRNTEQPMRCELGNVNSLNSLDNVMSPIVFSMSRTENGTL